MTGIFHGKVALVTGAARGIGEAAVRMFVAEGASVVLGDLLPEVEDLATDIRNSGGHTSALVSDVSDPASSEALVNLALEKYGRLDFAFNNAGIAGNAVPVSELPVEDWLRVINVNLNGVFYGNKYQVPAMLGNGGGVIINNSSVMGLKPIPGQSVEYTTSKHGVIGLTRQLAVNYAKEGIRCVAICPGFVETTLTASTQKEDSSHKQTNWFIDRTPMGRSGNPAEIASVVRLLCSDDASYITGATIEVDGGFLLS